MKKILVAILSTLFILSGTFLPVFASDFASISEDLQEITIDDDTYVRVDTTMLKYEYYNELLVEVQLTDRQKDAIKDVYLEMDSSELLIYAQITNRDGSVLSLDYIRSDYLSDYQKITGEQTQNYIIDFEWPEGNTVEVTNTKLFGKSIILDEYELTISDYYYVITQNDDENLTAITGTLLIVDEAFYYVDFREAEIYDWYEFDPSLYTELPAYQITNESVIRLLLEAEDAYYNDDMGFLLDNDLGDTLSAIFLIILFALIPLVIFILFLIWDIRSNNGYKKIFRSIWLLTAAELIIFTIITIIILVYR